MAPNPVHNATRMKRTSSEAGLDKSGSLKQKRRYQHHHALAYKQTIDDSTNPISQDQEGLDTQLSRAISLVLEAIGFANAEPSALESFRLITQEYMSHFLSNVAQSMLSSRRTLPIPSDFLSALNAHNLTLSSLLPHLNPPVARSQTQPPLLIQPPSEDEQTTQRTLQISSLLQDSAQAPPYIPTNLPSLPSKHTYNADPVFAYRESDPKVIREKATEEGRLGEEALRRLVSSRSRAENSKDARRRGGGMRQRGRELWRETMAKALGAEEDGMQGKESEFDEYSIRVNADNIYWRKPATGRGDGT